MISVSKILLPVAFSERCRGAAHYAGALACRFGAEVVLLHVVVPPYPAYGGGPEALAYSSAADVFAQNLEQGKAQLETFLADELQSLPVRRVLRQGDPAHSITEYAHEEKFELVVMPTHGYGPFRRFLLGSVTAKVLHDTDCPVWTGPHMEAAPARDSIGFHKVVCGLDLGPQSHSVLGWAAEFTEAFRSRLTIVHTLPKSSARLDGIYFDPEWRAQEVKAAQESISNLQRDLGVSCEARIETGDVPSALGDAARDLNADLMVIGRGHARGALGRLRTHAYGIIRESPCPVVSI